jgi:outer membrane lipopolysaccharide assembly protein LptE/RlpB
VGEGCGFELQNGYRLANRVTYVRSAAHFSQSASTLKSGDTGLTLNSGRVIKERQENVIHANLSVVSRRQIGCNCVYSNLLQPNYLKISHYGQLT